MKKFFTTLYIIITILTIPVTAYAADGFCRESMEPARVSGAVFVKGGNIYLYNEQSGDIKSLANNPMPRPMITFSPDKRKLAFGCFSKGKNLPQIGILDIRSNKLTTIPLSDSYAAQLMDISWVNNSVVLAEGHVNPDVEGYVIYNAVTGKKINECGGMLYQVLSDGKSMLFKLNPHIFPHLTSNITLRTTKGAIVDLYQVKDSQAEIFDARISNDLSKIAFWSCIKNKAAYINVASFNIKSSKIGSIKKYGIDSKVHGTLEFDSKNNVIIKSEKYIYELKGTKFIKTDAISAIKTGNIDEAKIEKLNKAVKRFFTQGDTENTEIGEIQWFSF